MSSFNADHDDLNEYYYTCFVESWEYNSSEKEEGGSIEVINDLCACLGKTDKFIDWIMEQMELNVTSDKIFRKAVLNTLDVDGLMMRCEGWRQERTCDKCRLCMVDCVCEDDECQEE